METPSRRARAPAAERMAFAAAAAFLLVPAAALTPRAAGDSGEYYLMAESLLGHASPEARGADAASLAGGMARHPVDGGMRTLSAYRPGRAGALHAQHFFAYPAATLPVRALLRLVGANEFKAFAITNALLLLGAAWLCLTRLPWPLRFRLLAVGLLLVSPVGWFVRWAHPEVYSASLVVAALVAWRTGAPVAATLAAAAASLQNPPLLILTGALWLAAVAGPAADRRRRALLATLAALPAAVPFAFNLWWFGTPSLIADENIHVSLIRPARALELFFDLNIGLIAYTPLTVVLALAATAVGLVRSGPRAALAAAWAVVLGMAGMCSAMHDWNHGTSGPSRYTVWLFPILVLAACEALARVRSWWPTAAAALALAAQAAVFVARAGFAAPQDYTRHSWLASLVLTRWPALYSPTHEIFIERTAQSDAHTEAMPGPFVYRAGGRCRKALAQKRHAATLRALCGAEPPAFAAFVSEVRQRQGGRGEWTYVDY